MSTAPTLRLAPQVAARISSAFAVRHVYTVNTRYTYGCIYYTYAVYGRHMLYMCHIMPSCHSTHPLCVGRVLRVVDVGHALLLAAVRCAQEPAGGRPEHHRHTHPTSAVLWSCSTSIAYHPVARAVGRVLGAPVLRSARPVCALTLAPTRRTIDQYIR